MPWVGDPANGAVEREQGRRPAGRHPPCRARRSVPTPARRASSAVACGSAAGEAPPAPCGAPKGRKFSRTSLGIASRRVRQPDRRLAPAAGRDDPQRHRHHLAGRGERVGGHPVDEAPQRRLHPRRVDDRRRAASAWRPRRRHQRARVVPHHAHPPRAGSAEPGPHRRARGPVPSARDSRTDRGTDRPASPEAAARSFASDRTRVHAI